MRKLTLLLALAAAGPAAAEAPERLDVFDDWAVFVSDDPRECFAISRATAETGWPAGLAPSESQILVTFRPENGDAPGEVSVWTGGRAIAPGTTLTLTAGDAHMLLFTDGDWAWPPNAAGDADAIAALSQAESAQVALLSGDMSPVTLDFSLTGFAPALARAGQYCATIGAGI